jgi:hypothetical protein
MVASEALVRLSRRSDGRAALVRVKQVKLAEGRRPEVEVAHGALRITVAPSLGLAGRPSSERIMAVAAQ